MGDINECCRVRRIVFCELNKSNDFPKVKSWLASYLRSGTLEKHEYNGLLAEVEFYEKYEDIYDLSLAADVGDKTDFRGTIDNRAVRIDVTSGSGLKYKHYSDYSRFIKRGKNYKIAYKEGTEFRIIDLSFARCNCGTKDDALQIPFVLFKGQNYSSQGTPEFSYDQELCTICPRCLTIKHLQSFSHYFMPPLSEAIREEALLEEEYDEVIQKPVDCVDPIKESFDAFWYFHRFFCGNLMAAAEIADFNRDMKHGIPDIRLKFSYISPIVSEFNLESYGLDDLEGDTQYLE